jgi:hypothetical protein
MSLFAAQPSGQKPVTAEAMHWLANDVSAQAPRWYSWSPGSGEHVLVGPLRTSTTIVNVSAQGRTIVDVSAHRSLIISLADKGIKTQWFWKEATSRPPYIARTSMGKRLWEIRQKILASGEPLLDWDDINREVQHRRGERDMEDLI